ncbi:MAG: TetR/AcrR family transcriptional regulator [Bryobacterales bacterium]|nr:TetR/AcrR family transcriptional regulator [Bryobacterales bacterium]
MGVTERRAREKEELRSRIIEAATELFVHEGYTSVSMRRIAEKIEYSPSTIYLYFKDKADLVTHICAETFRKLTAALDAIVSSGESASNKLRSCLRAYIDFGLQNPNHYYVTFCVPEYQWKDVSPETEGGIYQLGIQAFQSLRDGLTACQRSPEFRIEDVETTAQMVWTMIHGVTSLLITLPTQFPWVERERLIETSLDHILRSLRA